MPLSSEMYQTSSVDGQSYKHFTLVIYDSRIVVTTKVLTICLWVVNYERKVFVRLTTGE